ncbi:type VI secretion system tip protein TssI/VgrG [Diaphorobacter sp.]|uniref:type VI secretion system Vgr family protein n=1 Tax=Diaphorobacter sp. TaxID=1934310 RepID=UPI0028AC44D6|nr:type VI secretion system tip protein TssI/VgrG [Diaphorobacter sp.]
MSRTFIAHNPLGELLQFRSLSGVEQISRLFEFNVRLLSESPSIDPKSMLGKNMSIEIDLTTEMAGAGKRFLSGQITDFASLETEGDYYCYEAILRPWLWHASRRSDFKIFQFKAMPQVIKEVLEPYGFTVEDRLSGSYREWEYLVQYGETDLNFVSRLLEAEGAYYFFEHDLGGHRLIIGDDIGAHRKLPGAASSIAYYGRNGTADIFDEDYIDGWTRSENISSGNFAAKDYDFEKPKAVMDALQHQPAGHVEDAREIYEWPGGYTDLGDGENYARVRVEQQNALRDVARGQGNARNIAPGFLFALNNHPGASQNQDYLIETATYHFEENVRRSDGAGGVGISARNGMDTPTSYRVDFDAVPSSVPYRSQRITPKPHTMGPQTAVVTGPAGEEIYTDEYGRVKVQFNWDRYGSNDENSSVWIRVSQDSAGSGFGMMHIPRIGQEVIVDFLNGDPDYPIITGRVCNAMQMPPWSLPGKKTQSGVQTRTTPRGAPNAGNVIRLEDLKGAEEMFLFAQKDMKVEVLNNESELIGNTRATSIGNIDTAIVGVMKVEAVGVLRVEGIGILNKRAVGIGDIETIGLFKNSNVGGAELKQDGVGYIQNIGVIMMTNVGMLRLDDVGMDWMRLIGRDRATFAGRDSGTQVGRDYAVKAQRNVAIEAGNSIALKVGDSSIEITGDGIAITGPIVRINS